LTHFEYSDSGGKICLKNRPLYEIHIKDGGKFVLYAIK
jgi:hypothetical protein